MRQELKEKISSLTVEIYNAIDANETNTLEVSGVIMQSLRLEEHSKKTAGDQSFSDGSLGALAGIIAASSLFKSDNKPDPKTFIKNLKASGALPIEPDDEDQLKTTLQ